MVTTDVNTVTYNGDGSTTAFPFTFKIQDASEINLQLVQDDDTVTDITSDFYVDTVNSTVYYPGYAPGAEPPAADQPPKVQTGQKLTIWRDVPMTQENDLGDKWPFEEIENGLDKLTMICQQIYAYTNRKLDAALASMFQLAGIVTDSDKLQHITDQYNAIDANAAAAAESEENAAASATAAANSATASANSANNSAGSAASATTTANALINFLNTKETLTAPAVDPTLTISGAAADAQATGDAFSFLSYPAIKFHVNANASHSSSIDRIPVDIKSGETFLLSFKRNYTNQIQFWGYYYDGDTLTGYKFLQTTEKSGNVLITASQNLVYVGAFVTANDNADDYAFVVATQGSIAYNANDIPTLSKNVSDLQNLVMWYQKDVPLVAGTAHSASYDKIFINIPQGTSFKITVLDDDNLFTGNPQIYVVYDDGTSERIVNKTTRKYSGVAQKNIISVSIFLAADQVTATGNAVMFVEVESFLNVYWQPNDFKITKAVVIGAEAPLEAKDFFSVSQDYIDKMEEAIQAWMEEYQGDARKIPFIVCTDQHGKLNIARRGIFDILSYLVNWDQVSAFMQLGDTVYNNWEDNSEYSNPILVNAQLEAASECIKRIPTTKLLTMWGNHDTWYNGALPTEVSGVLPSYATLNPYFKESGLRTVRLPDNSNLKVVYDDYYQVKYVCVADWDYADKQGSNVGHTWYWVSKRHWEWIIAELTKNDGYDVVIVSHVPLVMGTERAIDPITQESIPAATTPTRFIHYTSLFDKIWYDRKMKLAGSFNVNGVVVNYDFTQCESPCYCALAGHTHYNGVDRVYASDGLLQVAFNWFNNDTLHFGIIDRANQKVKVWQLSGGTTPAVADWEAVF